jgi:hypothetical protein
MQYEANSAGLMFELRFQRRGGLAFLVVEGIQEGNTANFKFCKSPIFRKSFSGLLKKSAHPN